MPSLSATTTALQVCSCEEAATARAAVEERLRAKGDLSEEEVARLLTLEVRCAQWSYQGCRHRKASQLGT